MCHLVTLQEQSAKTALRQHTIWRAHFLCRLDVVPQIKTIAWLFRNRAATTSKG